jgi:3D (Asp-Asp-Asp) domain-containing protein
MKGLLCVALSMLCIAIATVIPTESSTTVAETTTATETTTTVVETTVKPIETTTKPQTKTMLVVATAYCPCVKCCGKWSDGITASGVKAKANHTIAVDRKVIPLGTVVLINGKQYVAEDTGSAIKGNKIDVYFDSHEEALKWGRQTIEIEVLL